MTLKLWLISQCRNNNYDSYDSAVVVAATEDDARNIHPNGNWNLGTWAAPADVSVCLVGDAVDNLKAGEIVCASFNAG